MTHTDSNMSLELHVIQYLLFKRTFTLLFSNHVRNKKKKLRPSLVKKGFGEKIRTLNSYITFD